MPLRQHIALFTFHPDVPPDQRWQIYLKLKQIYTSVPGSTYARVEWSLDERKCQVIEHLVFESDEIYEQFRQSEAHLAAVNLMKDVTDWWTADYHE